jgi:dienelactone hydrolase
VTAAVVFALPFTIDAASKSKKRRPRKSPEPTAVPRPPDPYRVTIPTADGVLLAGSWRPLSDDPGAPALLLLHDFARERRTFEPLAATFAERGFATLAIDLRGHGESTRKTSGTPVKLSPRLLSDPDGFPRDVDAACAWLRKRSPRVGVVGLSLGANLALLATASNAADAAVAVSANLERLAPLTGRRPSKARAALLLASENDPGRAESARKVSAAGDAPMRVLVFGGAAHGYPLLGENAQAKSAALAWLAERLGAKPRETPTPAPPPESTRPATAVAR